MGVCLPFEGSIRDEAGNMHWS